MKFNAAISQSSKDQRRQFLFVFPSSLWRWRLFGLNAKGHFVVVVVRLGVGLTLKKSDGLTTSAPISNRCTMHSTCLFFAPHSSLPNRRRKEGQAPLRLRVHTCILVMDGLRRKPRVSSLPPSFRADPPSSQFRSVQGNLLDGNELVRVKYYACHSFSSARPLATWPAPDGAAPALHLA